MITLAAMAAKEAAFTSGAASLTHGFAPVAVGGFAAGVLATGACCLAFAAPRMRRRRLAGGDGMWGTGRRRSRVARDYYAAPVESEAAPVTADDEADRETEATIDGPETLTPPQETSGPAGSFASGPEAEEATFAPEPTADLAETPAPGAASDLAGAFAPEAEILADSGADALGLPVGKSRYAELEELPPFEPAGNDVLALPVPAGDLPGKHRISSSDAERRSEARRAAPKHAAPSAGLRGKMAGRLGTLPVAARS
jgi:hypothetical protein